MSLTDNQIKVRDALTADRAATPVSVADATGLAYSTVTRLLRELADLGAAIKEPDGWHRNTGREASVTHEGNAHTGDKAPTGDDPAPALAVADANADEPSRPDTQALARHPNPGRSEPADQPAHADPVEAIAAAAGDHTGDERSRPRMAKGQLQDLVLAALRSATEPMGPTQLAKVLAGKSQGAISNACDRLVERGEAVLVNEAPRRFQATRTA